jgi:hypothetical protein
MTRAQKTFILDEVFDVLETLWEDTRKWDPMLNGDFDKAVEGVEDPDERGRIMERFEGDHDYAVGQRGAVQTLKHRFPIEQDRYRQRLIDEESWTGPRECCIAYLKDLDWNDDQWREEARKYRDGTHPLIGFKHDDGSVHAGTPAEIEEQASIYDKCVADNVPLREQITAGKYTVREYWAEGDVNRCCPWDNRMADMWVNSYRNLAEFWQAGGQTEDLTLGPIEVVNERDVSR